MSASLYPKQNMCVSLVSLCECVHTCMCVLHVHVCVCVARVLFHSAKGLSLTKHITRERCVPSCANCQALCPARLAKAILRAR